MAEQKAADVATVASVLCLGEDTRTRSHWRAWRSLAPMLTALATAPASTEAQQVGGALGVSLTVLPPVSTSPVTLRSFRVDRDGIARFETTPPITGPASAIVMSTVSSSVSGFVPVAQPPALVRGTPRRLWRDGTTRTRDLRASPWRYEIELGPAPERSTSHDVSVRLTHLIVPGT